MGIGKKIFLMPCIFFAIFFTVNINAGQEFNKWFEQDEDQQSTIVNAKCKDQNTNFRIAETQTRIKTQNPAASAIFPSNKRGEGCVQSEIQNLSSTTIGNQQFKISTIQSTPQHAQMNKDEFIQKTQKLQMPFIANNGQLDDTVEFYAKTFAGSVFVTKDGEIVYSLPGKDGGQEARDKMREARSKNQDSGYKRQEERIPTLANSSFLDQIVYPNQQCYTADSTHDTRCMSDILHHASCFWPPMCACYLLTKHNTHTENESITKGLVLKEELVGAKISQIKGEVPSATKVSYFKGNNPSKWKNNIATYELVNLGEVYKGIDLKLKAYGNNVEKLFTVKPGADPGQIKVRLSGIQPRESSKTEEIQPPESPFIKGDLTKSPSDSVVSAQSNEKGAVGTAVKSPLEKGARGLSTKSPLIKGARGLSVNEHGELEVETELGPVKFTKPIAYQMIDGKRVEVECKYTIADCGMQNTGCEEIGPQNTQKHTKEDFLRHFAEFRGLSEILNPKLVPDFNQRSEIDNPTLDTQPSSLATRHSSLMYGFKVASYDKNHDLIIDPLLASTYLGGDQADVPNCITLDNDGNIYVAGWTGRGFPATSDAYDTSNNGGYGSCDSFLAKLSGDLTQLLAATYLGGSSIEFITSIVIDKDGNVFVGGYAGNGSPEFPTTEGAFDTSWNGSNYTYYNGFISKFNEDLTQLLASTYLGGSGYDGDFLRSMAIDQNGNIYVTGDTDSRDFPISSSAYDTSLNSRDGFISKLNGDLSAVIASTFFGGSQQDDSNSIAIDSDGNVYITGFTSSSDLPTTDSAYDTTYNGYGYYSWMGDAFVSKLNGNLSELLVSTFLGGTKSEYANSVAIDRSGNIYISGWTHSSDFPVTTDAYDTHFDGNDGGSWEYPKGDVFISKLSNDLKELLNSTYLGGFSNDSPGSITIDSVGNIYVVGSTNSSDFPTTADAFEVSFGGSSNNDGFISKLNRYLTALLTSTYLGGDNSEDSVNAIAIKSTGDIYVAGHTMSSGFSTTTDAYDTSFNGSVFIPYWGTYGDAFVSRFYLPTSGCNDTELFITNIMPESGGDTGSVTMLISGCNFSGSTTVKLARDDQLDIKAEPVNVSEDGNSLYATFDLEGKERGVWDVVVTNPDDSSVTKEDAFTIEEGKTGDIWLDIVSRNAILIGRPQKFDILLTNSGNTDTVGAVLFGGIPKGTTIDLSPYYSLDLLLDDSDAVPEICENEDEMGVLFPTVTILTGFTKIVASFYLTIPTGEAHSMIELFASLGDD